MASTCNCTTVRNCASLGLVCAALATAGCMNSLWNGLIDPTQVGHFGASPVQGEIRSTLTIHDEPLGIPGSEDPQPADAEVRVEEYRLHPGDALQIQIFELLAPGTIAPLNIAVDDLGRVFIPEVGWLENVAGQTERELQETIRERLQNQGTLIDPVVQVTVLVRQGRTYTITGAVPSPGIYSIIRPDFRLWDALIMARDVPENVKEVYVWRRLGADPLAPPTDDADARGDGPDSLLPEKVSMAGGMIGTSKMTAQDPAATDPTAELLDASLPSPVRALPDEARRELTTPEPDPETGVQPAPEPDASDIGTFRYLEDEQRWVEVVPGTPDSTTNGNGPSDDATIPPIAQIDWNALAEGEDYRIIRIPLDRLRRLDPRYNIVIRNGDLILAPLGMVGEFYMMGHVNRPGPYTLTGRQVTLKQAIAAAGGLSALAWPSRCEIIRRVGGSGEQVIPVDLDAIFNGQANDHFLRPDDIVNVGTNAIAPFLATVRSAFRVSYGFGFVYDRNFADIDSFAGQQNPTDRRRFERRARFPGLF